MSRVRRTRALLLPVLLCATAVCAQTVEDVVAKHIVARGGLARISAVQSRRIEGHLELAGGREAKLVSEQKRPGRIRMDFIVGEMTASRAFDGASGWHFLPFAGDKAPQTISGQELRDISEDADIDGPLVGYYLKGHTVDLVPGNCVFDNRPCYHLKIRLKDGNVQHQYLDRDSFLTIGMVKNAEDGSEVEAHLGNYRRVEGIAFSFHSEVHVVGQPEVQKYTVDKVELNVPIDDARFKMPAAPRPETAK